MNVALYLHLYIYIYSYTFLNLVLFEPKPWLSATFSVATSVIYSSELQQWLYDKSIFTWFHCQDIRHWKIIQSPDALLRIWENGIKIDTQKNFSEPRINIPHCLISLMTPDLKLLGIKM